MPYSSALSYCVARGYECAWLGLRVLRRVAHHPTFDSGRMPRAAVSSGCVALTIDDGPHPDWTPAMLDLLARHGVTATFFLIGANAERHPGLARRIVEAGHAVGNHSTRHPQPFAALTTRRLREEIDVAQAQIGDAVGEVPRLFRAPGGGWSPRVLAAANDAGLTCVDWSLNPSDWKEPGIKRIVRRTSRTRSGDVVLCHDGGGDRSQTIAALEVTIPLLRSRGLEFVTVPDTDRTRH